MADLTEAWKLDPKDVDALSNRGYTKLELQHYQGAVAELTEALKRAVYSVVTRGRFTT